MRECPPGDLPDFGADGDSAGVFPSRGRPRAERGGFPLLRCPECGGQCRYLPHGGEDHCRPQWPVCRFFPQAPARGPGQRISYQYFRQKRRGICDAAGNGRHIEAHWGHDPVFESHRPLLSEIGIQSGAEIHILVQRQPFPADPRPGCGGGIPPV